MNSSRCTNDLAVLTASWRWRYMALKWLANMNILSEFHVQLACGCSGCSPTGADEDQYRAVCQCGEWRWSRSAAAKPFVQLLLQTSRGPNALTCSVCVCSSWLLRLTQGGWREAMTKQPFIFSLSLSLYLNIAAPACIFPISRRSVPAVIITTVQHWLCSWNFY